MTTLSPRHPVWGDLPAYRRDPLGFGRALTAKGRVANARFFTKRVFFVTEPELIHQVLVRDAAKFRKSPAYRVLEPTLGQGLLTSDGDFWRRQRRLVQPAFHHARVASYADIMVLYAQERRASWHPGRTLAINHEMMELTLRVVAKALFDTDITAQAGRIKAALETLLRAATETISTPIPLPAWLPTPRNRRSQRATKALDEIVYEMIDARRRSGQDTGDLLSMLLAAVDDEGQGMSDKAVRDEAVTLILAGHETTANALTWAFYLLAQHPEVEATLRAEVQRVLGERAPTFADLGELRYTDLVVKETMRLFPPAPEIGRLATEEVVLGDLTIPAGSIVVIPIHVVHRDPRWFDEPDAFRPERFADTSAWPKFAYLPFGGGPRVCIGNAFAQMEATLLLATLTQGRRLRLVPHQQITPEATLTLRPKRDLLMRVESV
jgi:cytochrome P450